MFTLDMTTTQTTKPNPEPRCATCNQPYGHCYDKDHEWTPKQTYAEQCAEWAKLSQEGDPYRMNEVG